jgi:hypothetical protein
MGVRVSKGPVWRLSYLRHTPAQKGCEPPPHFNGTPSTTQTAAVA